MSYLFMLFHYLAWTVAALYLIMTAGIWLTTLHALGWSSLPQCRRMLALSLRAGPIKELLIALALPLAAAGLAGTNLSIAYYVRLLPVNAFALISVLCFSLFLVPPLMIVLSTSTDAQLRWALGLKRFTLGRRVVSFLDTGQFTPSRKLGDMWSIMLARSGSLTDVLRVPDNRDWRRGVRELMGLCPIIVIDSRVCTPALLFEATLALTPLFRHKTIFVCGNDGTAALLEALSQPLDSQVMIVSEDDLGPLIQKLVSSRKSATATFREIDLSPPH